MNPYNDTNFRLANILLLDLKHTVNGFLDLEPDPRRDKFLTIRLERHAESIEELAVHARRAIISERLRGGND